MDPFAATNEANQFSGIGGGFDARAMVDQLVKVERQGVASMVAGTAKMMHQAEWHDEVAVGLAGLRAVLRDLDSADKIARLRASSDHPGMSADCTAEALPGVYHLEVLSTARAQVNASAPWPQTGRASPALAPGWLELKRPRDTAPWRTRLDGQTTARDLSYEITGAGLGIRADIVHADTHDTLLELARGGEGEVSRLAFLRLSGLVPGRAHGFTIVEDYDTPPAADGGSGLHLGLVGGHALEADDTRVRVDGHELELVSDSLHLRGAVAGVALRLSSPQRAGFTATVHVDVDVDAISAQLQRFVDAYNQAAKILAAATRPPRAKANTPAAMRNAGERAVEDHREQEAKRLGRPQANNEDQRETLHRHPALRLLAEQMKRVMSEPVEHVKPFAIAQEVGLAPRRDALQATAEGPSLSKAQADGSLQIDADRLGQAARRNPLSLARLFAGAPTLGVTGIFGQLALLIDPHLRVDGLQAGRLQVLSQVQQKHDQIERKYMQIERNRQQNLRRFRTVEHLMSKAQTQDAYLSALSSQGNNR